MTTVEQVRQRLDYSIVSGKLYWKAGKRAGRVAGTVSKKRKQYVQLRLDGKNLLAHRVAWAIVYGEWPDQFVDHENGDGTTNGWHNLRLADRFINSQNIKGPNKGSKTGVLGVKTSKWGGFIATIQANGKVEYLGTYPTIKEASDIYMQARRDRQQGNTL